METEIFWGKLRPAKSECEKYKQFCIMNKRLEELKSIIERLPEKDNSYFPIQLTETLERSAELMHNNLLLGIEMLNTNYKFKKIEFDKICSKDKIQGTIAEFSHWGTYAPFFNVTCVGDHQQKVTYQVMLGDFTFVNN